MGDKMHATHINTNGIAHLPFLFKVRNLKCDVEVIWGKNYSVAYS